jgi:hypothetical protein
MSDPKFPAGWDAARVKLLIDHYQSQSEEEQVLEDGAATAEFLPPSDEEEAPQ